MRRAALVALFALLLVPVAHASNRYDPRLRFRTLSTPRFDIHFHQGGDELARRLASLADAISKDLEPRLGRPRARVHVILVDQTDIANGWATPVPYNLIEIVVASPRGDSTIGNTSDWLRSVFTHEYSHVLHLERSRGFVGAVGRAFGRNPFFYPNLALPIWQIEGLATYHESAMLRDGRVFAGDFRMWMTGAAGAQRFETLDRASNALVEWPDGHAPYLYGAYFHQYLADKYGEASLHKLADATAGRFPYLGSPAFKKVFGKSLGALWSDFEESAATRAPRSASSGRQLTHHGFVVNDPWFTSSGQIVYSVSNPHEFPALMAWEETGTTRLAPRFGGHQVSSHASRVFFDQLEYVRSVGLQSDLYVREANGRVRRLTREARAADPDVSPDGKTIVCVVQRPQGRALATVPASGGEPTILLYQPGIDYSSPRWSVEGSRIVAERRALGRPSEVVIFHRSGDATLLTQVTVSARGRNTTPIWSRDGRHIYFASDRDGGPFRLYSFEFQGARLQRLAGIDSAQAPALSPDGRTLVFVGYTPAGYDLFSIPLADANWEDAENEPPPRVTQPASSAASTQVVEGGYSPWATLLPRFWTPIIEEDGENLAVGAATSGADALGRHGYYASAAWSTRGRPDWAAAYAYDRWRPTLFANLQDDQESWRSGDIRAREVNAGAQMSFRRVRRVQTIVGTFHAAREQIDCTACEPSINAQVDRRAWRAGWLFDGARRFGYSISDEEGFSAALSAEWSREALGADGNAAAVVGDLRGYLRAGPRHAVIAARAGAAHAWGDEVMRRVFAAGANSAAVPLLDFDPDAVALVRGFETVDVNGRTAIVANLDYRLPLAWIERGPGTWPVFLRSIHGALFADGGGAWDGDPSRDDWRASFGAEVSSDVVLGYSVPLTLTAGVAFRYDPTHRSDGVAVFARVGRAF